MNMYVVGDFLKKFSLENGTSPDVKLYVRSAYNRYYYNCFYAIRQCMLDLNYSGDVKKIKHGSDLNMQFNEFIRTKVAIIENSATASNAERQLAQAARQAAKAVGRPLTDVYDTRAAADYQMECDVLINDDIHLKFIKPSTKKEIMVASNEVIEMTEDINKQIQAIQVCLKQLGLA